MQTNSDTPTPRDHDRRLCPPWFARVGVLAVLLLVGAAIATPPAVAAAPAAGDWPQFGRTAQHPNTNPAETAFTPGNVAGLAVAWTGQFGEADETEATPEEFTGNLFAFAFAAAGCGKATCKPLRTYDVGDAGSNTTPALVGDTLLASTQATPDPNTSGVVAAFPAHGCGAAVCEPLWTGVNFADGFESSPVVAGKVVFVGKGPASGFPVDAGVYAFDVRGCGRPVCQPRGFTQLGPDQSYQGSSIAVAGGKVMLNSTDNTGAPDVPAQTNLYVLALPES